MFARKHTPPPSLNQTTNRRGELCSPAQPKGKQMEEKTKLPVRKKIRMENFDYSSAVAYFITICTKDRKPLFWKNDCLKSARANYVYPHLTEIGECVNTEINNIDSHYDNVIVDKYCIMPDHIHLIIFLLTEEDGRSQTTPTISRVMKQFKGSVTKQIGWSIWQKSFADRVIRNELGYQSAWRYIENNPRKPFE